MINNVGIDPYMGLIAILVNLCKPVPRDLRSENDVRIFLLQNARRLKPRG
jgi:hypothetical protein